MSNLPALITARAALTLPLLTIITGCPDDVPLETASTGAESSGTHGPDTSGGVITSGPIDSSSGASTGEPGETGINGDSTGPDTTGGASTSGDSTTSGSSGTGETTADASTSDGTTSGGTTSGGTTSGETTSGETTSGGTTSGETTSGETTGDDSTTGGEELGKIDLCCQAGCSATLLQSAAKHVDVQHGGARFTTHDELGHLVLWDAATRTPVLRVDGVDSLQLVGETLVYAKAGMLHVVDAISTVESGVCPATTAYGVAQDESYVWTAGPQGLEVLETDCGLRWSIAGPLGAAKVLAAPDMLHVYEPDLAALEVVHFDAADGNFATMAFTGAFGGWFADVPRWWTTQGDTHRLYDLDGTVLSFANGTLQYGWGTRVVGSAKVWDIFDAESVALNVTPEPSGPALLLASGLDGQILRLDQDPLVPTPIVIAGGLDWVWSFGFAADAWVIGGTNGRSVDHLQQQITPGEIVSVIGSGSGRAAAHLVQQELRLYDADSGDCSATLLPALANTSPLLHMSGDGALLLSFEKWMGQFSAFPGTRFYALPGGEKLGEQYSGAWKSAVHTAYDVDDAATGYGVAWDDTSSGYSAGPIPPGVDYINADGDVAPKLAPDGVHMVHSDGDKPLFGGWAGKFSYVRNPVELVSAFEGIPHGFLDNEHILVGRYVNINVFSKMEIVGLDGVVVQPSTLPEIRRMIRVGTGEILGIKHASGDAAIFDPFTGEELWTAPPDTAVAVAGPDHVIVSDRARLELVRWR